jgi:hypothetical protein
MLTGASMGGYHSVNIYLRRPDIFGGCFSMSGLFHAGYFFPNYTDMQVYYNSPVDYMRNMPYDHPLVEQYRRGRIVICCGQGAWEDEAKVDARCLKAEFERLNNQTIKEKIEEISDFIELISQKLDEKQAIVALQTGLSLLNKNRKDCILKAKNALKEDGIYGEKTKASLYEACKNYNSRVIKKYILKGVLNNIIFNTKNEDKIDTQKLLNETKLSLEEKI